MIVSLQGGLGNQLFQMAFGLSLASQRNEELFFTRFRVDADSKRSYSLGPFKGSESVRITGHETQPVIGEPVFAFNPAVYNAPRGATFLGHWQTEKYFNPRLVHDAMQLRVPVSDRTRELADEIGQLYQRSAFIHVRRGDYTWAENVVYHGSPTRRYYDEAIERIRQATPDAHFYLFSDEPEWCRANFSGASFTVIDHNKPGDANAPGQEHEDLYLMSLCRHAVIANSSFSWWGAWLGDLVPAQNNDARIVIGPDRWFVVQLESKDIIPERWLKLAN